MSDVENEVTQKLQEAGVSLETKETKPAENTQEQESERALSDFEQEQQAKGWNPNGPKSAEEWARNEPLYEEIKKRGKENKELKRTLDNLKVLMDKQEQIAYTRAYNDIMNERNIAMQRGDSNKVQQLDQQAVELQKAQPVPVIPAVEDFKERHSEWLNGLEPTHLKMQLYARQLDAELYKRGLPPEKHMEILEKSLKEEFTNYFDEPSAKKTKQAVESNTSPVSGGVYKKKYTFNDLSDIQKKVAKDFQYKNVMTVEKYIEMLVNNGDLK